MICKLKSFLAVINPHVLVDLLALKGQDLPWHVPPNREEVRAPTTALLQHCAGESEEHCHLWGWDRGSIIAVRVLPLPEGRGRTGRGRSKGGPGRGKMGPAQARLPAVQRGTKIL